MNHITITTGRFPFKVIKTVTGSHTGSATYVVLGCIKVTATYEFDSKADVAEFLR